MTLPDLTIFTDRVTPLLRRALAVGREAALALVGWAQSLAPCGPSAEDLQQAEFWRRLASLAAARSAFNLAPSAEADGPITSVTAWELETSAQLQRTGGTRDIPGRAMTWEGRVTEMLEWRLAALTVLKVIERLFCSTVEEAEADA